MKKINYILFLIILLIANSCKDVIDISLCNDDIDLYAVEAKITSDDNPYVYFYKTQVVSSNADYAGICNAVVTISDNSIPEKSIQLIESNEIPGLYITGKNTEYKGEPGKIYSVRISTNGIILTASDSLAKVCPIDSIQVCPSVRGEFLGIFINLQEPKGMGNYYKWDIYSNNKLVNNKNGTIVVSNDKAFDGNYILNYEIYTDFYDKTNPDNRKINVGNTLQVKQSSLSRFAYNYYYNMFIQSSSDQMFSVPPANIKSNFTASDSSIVIGLFTAHDVSSSNLVIIDETLENQLFK